MNRDYSQLLDEGFLKLVDLTDAVDETGVFVPGRLPLQATYVFPELDPGQRVASFTFTFRVRMGGGTERGAQGFALVLASDIDTTVPFREGGGTTTGLTISFDEIDGLAPAAGAAGVSEGNDPGDAPGIIIKQGGRKIDAKRFDGLRTDGPGAGHPPVFVPVVVKLDEDGTLDVSYNGVEVYADVPIGYVPLGGQFAFGAGTEEQTAVSRDNFWIDDVSITTTAVTGPSVVAVEPVGQDVRPDAPVRIDIDSLAGGAIQLEFDGSSVTSSQSTSGDITTVQYAPPQLVPGSSHTVKLTYAGKTFLHAFRVADAAVIPSSAALAAASVDTSSSGFTVRVHQTEQAQGSSDADRAERQLAGELGPNIADLSSANADGTFDLENINMDQDGFDAGDFNSVQGFADDLIPGIPGTLGGNDSIAMEILGYLDLQPGAYSIGTVSDDSLRLSIGADPRDITALRLIDIPGGRAVVPFIVQQAGIYPIRALWTEGSGPANLELWSQAADGTEVLLNDRNTTGQIRSYRQRTANAQVPPYLAQATPGPGDVNVPTRPRIQLTLVDDSTTVVATSIHIAVNDTPASIPDSAITKTGNRTVIAFDLPFQLTANATQTLALDFTDSAGATVSRQFTFTTGNRSGSNAANAVKGYWTFDGDLTARVGRDLAFLDDSLRERYKFGTTGQGDFADVPDIAGQPASVLFIPYVDTGEADANGPIHPRLGVKALHTIAPNGGGQKVNQYTVILDVLWGENGFGFGPILQLHDLDAPGDADMFWQRSTGAYGKSCCSSYAGLDVAHSQPPGQWARVVFAVDLAANPPVLAKYINGFKHTDVIGGTRGRVDSEFALNVPDINLFADEDNERQDMWVSAVQIREGRMSDEEVAALGGPSAAGIPLPYSSWEFDNASNPLKATVGHDLAFLDSSLSARYQAGVTGQGSFADVPDIDGAPAGVLFIPYVDTTEADATGPIHPRLGFETLHGLAPNGGGQKVNQYTVILDLLWGDNGFGFGPIFQLHDLGAPGDADMFWQRSTGAYGKSCCSSYSGLDADHTQQPGEWARVVFAVDLAASPPVLAKFINGFKHTDVIGGTRGRVDSEFALNVPDIHLFADEDNERQDMWVNSVQVRQGKMSDDEIAALGGASAAGIPTPNPVKSEWNFDDPANPLRATIGRDLAFLDPSLSGRYKTGLTGQGDFADVPDIDGRHATVLFMPYVDTSEADAQGPVHPRLGLQALHGIAANGGGQKVNQYTVILDLLWGENGFGFGPILQLHDLGAPGDADMFWQRSTGAYGKSCCSTYSGLDVAHSQPPGQWARVVFAVDLAANPPVFAKYINGFKHTDVIGGTRGRIDSEFALNVPDIHLFADEDNERQDMWVNAVQIREGRMSDEEIAALGGPSAAGIPSASIGVIPSGGPAPEPPKITAVQSGASLTLSWPATAAEFTLESTDSFTVPVTWTTVPGVANASVTVPIGTGTRFYRLRK